MCYVSNILMDIEIIWDRCLCRNIYIFLIIKPWSLVRFHNLGIQQLIAFETAIVCVCKRERLRLIRLS